MTDMTAVASFEGLPIDDPNSLQDVTTPIPELRPHDVLVRVMAVSVTHDRQSRSPSISRE
jgi:NADPH:quinone reductase